MYGIAGVVGKGPNPLDPESIRKMTDRVEGVRKLPPSHNLSYDLRNHQQVLTPYYELKALDLPTLSDEEAAREYGDLLADLVEEQVRIGGPGRELASGTTSDDSMLAGRVGFS